jgi:hypothetical protein
MFVSDFRNWKPNAKCLSEWARQSLCFHVNIKYRITSASSTAQHWTSRFCISTHEHIQETFCDCRWVHTLSATNCSSQGSHYNAWNSHHSARRMESPAAPTRPTPAAQISFRVPTSPSPAMAPLQPDFTVLRSAVTLCDVTHNTTLHLAAGAGLLSTELTFP